jgi:hypothetical protein
MQTKIIPAPEAGRQPEGAAGLRYTILAVSCCSRCTVGINTSTRSKVPVDRNGSRRRRGPKRAGETSLDQLTVFTPIWYGTYLPSHLSYCYLRSTW